MMKQVLDDGALQNGRARGKFNSDVLLPLVFVSEDPIDGVASGGRPYWESVLDDAIKMLLYLTVRDAHVVHDRAYSGASRDLSGLGKRRRSERSAEIEML